MSLDGETTTRAHSREVVALLAGPLSEVTMTVELNHTIVATRDPEASARFLADVLGLPEPAPFGPFMVVETGNRVSLDYLETDGEIVSQHYAFLVTEEEFDQIFGRIEERELPYWADPGRRRLARSTATTAAEGCTSPIRTDTCWRSSPGPTAAAESRTAILADVPYQQVEIGAEADGRHVVVGSLADDRTPGSDRRGRPGKFTRTVTAMCGCVLGGSRAKLVLAWTLPGRQRGMATWSGGRWPDAP
jgi:hypothetical protein